MSLIAIAAMLIFWIRSVSPEPGRRLKKDLAPAHWRKPFWLRPRTARKLASFVPSQEGCSVSWTPVDPLQRFFSSVPKMPNRIAGLEGRQQFDHLGPQSRVCVARCDDLRCPQRDLQPAGIQCRQPHRQPVQQFQPVEPGKAQIDGHITPFVVTLKQPPGPDHVTRVMQKLHRAAARQHGSPHLAPFQQG